MLNDMFFALIAALLAIFTLGFFALMDLAKRQCANITYVETAWRYNGGCYAVVDGKLVPMANYRVPDGNK